MSWVAVMKIHAVFEQRATTMSMSTRAVYATQRVEVGAVSFFGKPRALGMGIDGGPRD